MCVGCSSLMWLHTVSMPQTNQTSMSQLPYIVVLNLSCLDLQLERMPDNQGAGFSSRKHVSYI